jgi:HEAT repeat protein
MPAINPEVPQWIDQMGDKEQVVAFFAYQSLLEQVLHSGAGQTEMQVTLAEALGGALTAVTKLNARNSVAGNAFLSAVASQTVNYVHPPRVRVSLARLLGYMPVEAAVPFLAKALEDLDARDMARCSLEANPSEKASDALIEALDSVGGSFRAGVVNSLAKRKGARVAAALRKAAEDPQPEVRLAVLEALADVAEASHDAILEKATRAASPAERGTAHIARARLAETLRASGDRRGAERIYKAILASGAEEPQKKAARLALNAG